MDTWTHKYTATVPYKGTDYGKTAKFTVEAGLHQLGGNQRPYFSVTAEIRRLRASDCNSCGCMHEEVIRHFPVLKPVIALHLCDDTGYPMHAEANGWYALGGFYGTDEQYHAGNSKRGCYDPETGKYLGYREPTPDECLASFAGHVRIPVSEARTLAESWRADTWPATRANFAAWLETQRERYQREADTVVALLDLLNASK